MHTYQCKYTHDMPRNTQISIHIHVMFTSKYYTHSHTSAHRHTCVQHKHACIRSQTHPEKQTSTDTHRTHIHSNTHDVLTHIITNTDIHVIVMIITMLFFLLQDKKYKFKFYHTYEFGFCSFLPGFLLDIILISIINLKIIIKFVKLPC